MRQTSISCLSHTLNWAATQARALTGNQTSDLSVHRPVLNLLSHTSQGKINTMNKKIKKKMRTDTGKHLTKTKEVQLV